MATPMPNVFECWAEQGGIRLRVTLGSNGRVDFEVVNVLDGWPGAVVAGATLAAFRVRDLTAWLHDRVVPSSVDDPAPKPDDREITRTAHAMLREMQGYGAIQPFPGPPQP